MGCVQNNPVENKEENGYEENHDKGDRPDWDHGGGSVCGIGLSAGPHPHGDRQHKVTYGERHVPVIRYAFGTPAGRACGWNRLHVL